MKATDINPDSLTRFPFAKVDIPARYHELLRTVLEIQPGLASEPCRFVLDNFDSLTEGNMLILSGPIGCGKTFAAYVGLMLYVAGKSFHEVPEHTTTHLGVDTEHPDEYVHRGADVYGLAVSAREIIKAAFDKDAPDYPNLTGLLMVDDLGREHFTDKGFGISEWDYFFDKRYSGMLPTIITTNLTTKELVSKYNRRIYDRMRECATWGQFTGGSLRKKTSMEGMV